MSAFQLSHEAYSAYPEEQEVVLIEGIKMFVTKVEHKVRILNKNEGCEEYNKKQLTIIYLFNASWDGSIINKNINKRVERLQRV